MYVQVRDHICAPHTNRCMHAHTGIQMYSSIFTRNMCKMTKNPVFKRNFFFKKAQVYTNVIEQIQKFPEISTAISLLMFLAVNNLFSTGKTKRLTLFTHPKGVIDKEGFFAPQPSCWHFLNFFRPLFKIDTASVN